MSRAEHNTTRRRVLAGLVPSVLGLGLAALLAGCGAGQITQTDLQQSAVNGASGNVGAMAVRNAQLAAPTNPQGVYQPGDTARLVVTIVNTGLPSDTLTKVASPAAVGVTIDGSADGTKAIPGGFAVTSGPDVDDTTPSSGGAPATTAVPTSTTGGSVPSSGAPSSGAPSSGAPSGSATPSRSASPLPPAKVAIDLTGIKSVNGAPLRAGITIPVTFYFAHAGQLTLQVPIGAPADTSAVLSAANG